MADATPDQRMTAPVQAVLLIMTFQTVFGLVAPVLILAIKPRDLPWPTLGLLIAQLALFALAGWMTTRFRTRRRRLRTGMIAFQAFLVAGYLAVEAADPGLTLGTLLSSYVVLPVVVTALLCLPHCRRWFDR